MPSSVVSEDAPRLMMTTGPVEVSPRVLRALGSRLIHHSRPQFVKLYNGLLGDLQKIWKTKNDMVILHGEGILGVEASIASTIEPNDKVIVSSAGVFGSWFQRLVEAKQGRAILVGSSDPRKETDLEHVKQALDENRDASLLIAVHCETVSSIVNDIGRICAEAKKRGICTAVDAISSIAGQEFRTDEWGVDLCIGTSQHCLSCPPGLTPVSVSGDAWEKMEAKKHPVRDSYLSFLDMKETWLKGNYFPYTPLVSEVYALAEACKEILEDEGLENVFHRHHLSAEMARSGVEAMGLELYPQRREISADTVTTAILPREIQDSRLIESVLANHDILIGGGYRELKGRIFRIGHSGYAATPSNVISTLAAVETELRRQGYKCRPGTAVEAALVVQDKLAHGGDA
jgi:pyridoxamine--pyruvate transaminase